MSSLRRVAPLLAAIGAFLVLNQALRLQSPFLAFAPILVVLAAMLFYRLGGHLAGPLGLAVTLILGFQSYGLTPLLLFYSQYKALLLSVYVLMVFVPALMLYQTVNHAGGVAQVAQALRVLVSDRPLLLLVTAIGFSALLEGVAGFGLPVAIASPILINLGMPPLQAIAAVSIGHSWSVTYGDMGAIFLTLKQLVQTPPELFSPYMALLLGIGILLCALAVTHLLRAFGRWPAVLAISAAMMLTQTACVLGGLVAISDLAVGMVAIFAGALLSRYYNGGLPLTLPALNRPLKAALLSYGFLAALLFLITSVPPIFALANRVQWQVSFPQLASANGFVTPAITNRYAPLVHTGFGTLVAVAFAYLLNQRLRLYNGIGIGRIAADTLRASWQAVAGILAMVGLAAIMDHTGMTRQMAQTVSGWFGNLYPLVSPLIGTLGAFATGSNSNSNVLFARMQEDVATLLGLAPALMIAAQTTGGSLGSMVAPAKISVGCTTSGMAGHEGDVLRITLPYGLAIGAVMGIITYLVAGAI